MSSGSPAADPLDAALAASRARGERVAVATLRTGPRAGQRLLVWSAGQTFGDLGWPRLNQRVALYAEQLFDRGATAPAVKTFEGPEQSRVEVAVEFSG